MDIKNISEREAAAPLRAGRATERLREEILAQIDAGTLKRGDKVLALRGLAARYGVAFVSAQRAVRALCEEGFLQVRQGRGTYATGKRRAAAAARPAGRILYVYDKTLQSLPGSRLNHFYLGVLNGAQEAAAARGCDLVYRPVTREIGAAVLDELSGRAGGQGILLVGEEIDHALAFLLRERGVRPVLVDHFIDATFSSVVVHCAKAVAEAAGSLFKRGHRRLGFVGKSAAFPSIREKLAGFRAAHRAARIPCRERFIRAFEQMEEVPSIVRDMLDARTRPTAIIAEHDYVALSVIETCRALGVAVPGQLSVVGCDDIEPARTSSPSVSTIRIDTGRMGRVAVEAALGGAGKPVVRRIGGTFIERASTGNAPRGAGR
ncbi:MAG: substrate-binding domain-containing protein [Kiritimatiellae bacterium]|nr:substrate-binding domain-containing protein [Kiritimatiellia bacterium]